MAAVDELKVAAVPLGVRVPPAGVALQVTPPEQLPVEVTVAVNADAWPVGTKPGFDATATPVTVQALLPPPPPPPPPPQAVSAAAEISTVHIGQHPTLRFPIWLVPPGSRASSVARSVLGPCSLRWE